MSHTPDYGAAPRPALVSAPVDVGWSGREARKPLRPGTEYVYSDANGQVFAPGRRLKIGEARGGWTRYEVDVSGHTETREAPLPGRDNVAHFTATATFTWFVHDPVTLVRRQTADGPAVLWARMLTRMGQITRGYSDEGCTAANEEINRSFAGTQPVTDVFSLVSFDVHLRVSGRYGVKVEKALDQADGIELSDTARTHTLEALERHGDLALVAGHLAQHPGDYATVLDMLLKGRVAQADSGMKMFERLRDAGIITDADLPQWLDALLRSGGGFALPGLPQALAAPPQAPVPQPRALNGPAPAPVLSQDPAQPRGPGPRPAPGAATPRIPTNQDPYYAPLPGAVPAAPPTQAPPTQAPPTSSDNVNGWTAVPSDDPGETR
jgi:hypothetical protein